MSDSRIIIDLDTGTIVGTNLVIVKNPDDDTMEEISSTDSLAIQYGNEYGVALDLPVSTYLTPPKYTEVIIDHRTIRFTLADYKSQHNFALNVYEDITNSDGSTYTVCPDPYGEKGTYLGGPIPKMQTFLWYSYFEALHHCLTKITKKDSETITAALEVAGILSENYPTDEDKITELDGVQLADLEDLIAPNTTTTD